MGNLRSGQVAAGLCRCPISMASHGNHVVLGTGAGSTLGLGSTADETVAEHRASLVEGMGSGDRLGVLLVGGGFLVAAATFVWLNPVQPVPSLLVVALYIGVYA